MSLVERWSHLETSLEQGWTEATLSLEIHDADARSRAAALLGPAGPGFAGSTIRFTVSTRGHGVGPDGASRLLKLIDGEGIPGRLELVSSATTTPAMTTITEPAIERRTLSDSWRAALEMLPADWSDVLAELELDSSADVDRSAVLCAPLNPQQSSAKPGLNFRCANHRGYGASAGMVARCLTRLDDDGISGRVRIARVLSDVHPVATQGAVFSIGRRPRMTELADAVQKVAESARSLVQLEIQLAIAEIKKKLAMLGIGVGLAAGAVYLLSIAILFILGAATAGLTYVMPIWAALLVMAVLLLLIATGLALVGIKLMQRGSNMLPEEAIEEAQRMREDLHDAGIT